ncbi:hypothetical protein N2152v2_008117 [Parachlorella kessleri]
MEPDVQSALLACSSFFRWRLQTAEAAFKSELETALAAATQDEEQLGQLQLAVAASQSEVDRLRSELSAAQQLLERETAACTGHQAHGRCLQQQLDAAQAELSVSQKLGEAVQAQLEQAALEMAALQARLAVAERTSDELAATQQAASEQSRELQTAQRAAERLGQQLQLADAERAGATDAELQLRGRVAKLEVAVADESMKAELQASKAQSLQRQLADEQHRVSELALQLERHQAHDKVIKDLKEDKKALQEEKMMLEVQLQAAHAALAGFGRSLSRAAADQCPHSGELTEVGSESLASEAPGGHAEEGTSPAALEGIDCDAAGYCTENDSIGPQASSGSMDGEGIAHERDTGRDVRGRGDSSASEEAIGDAADGLLQMVVDQQQRIEGLDAALRAAEDRHTVSTAVAKQTVQKLMMEVGRTEASGKALQQSLLERDRQLNTLQQEHECASRQGALFEAQIAQLTAALQQHDSDKARLEVERGQQLAALQAALEQQRSASQQAAALQAELASLQAQLAEERAAAQQQLAQQLAEVKGRGQGDARQAAASLQAAQNEIQQLRAKLENTEAVAQVVIGKLEAKLVARQGSSHEVAAKLQARCTAAARAAHDAMHALQSERELWSCVRATYIERVGKLERALRREGALCDASVAAKAAKAVAELERAQTIQSIKPEPQLRQPFVAHSKQPDMPLAMTSPLSHVQQPQQQQVLQQLQFPAQQQGMMSLVPFTIPAVGTTGSPAILAMPLQLAAFGQPPASASLVQPFASQQGGMQAQPVQGLSPSPAGAERMLSLAATRSKLSSGTASAPAQPLLPAQQQPMLAEEHGLGGSPPDVILPLTKATAALNAGCQEPGISALTPAGASPAQQPFAASRKVPPGVKKMLTADCVIAPGVELHGIRVVKELNRGGTAVVYEGHVIATATPVALKVMTVKDSQATPSFQAVQREVEYAGSIQHPNIVKLLGYFTHGPFVVLVWELIRGLDLLDKLNECGGRLEESKAALYFSQLLQAVHHVHVNGMCHRDLKPENCIVETITQRLVLIDFGLSRSLSASLGMTLGVGTPDYMSPELIAGGSIEVLKNRTLGRYDPVKSDVWALGVLLFLLVSGQYPFEDPLQPQNVVATLGNIARGRRKALPRRVSPQCAALIESMLCLDPSQRLTLQEIAAHPWLALHGQAVQLLPILVAAPPNPGASHAAGHQIPRIPAATDSTCCHGMDLEESQSGFFMSAESSLAAPGSPHPASAVPAVHPAMGSLPTAACPAAATAPVAPSTPTLSRPDWVSRPAEPHAMLSQGSLPAAVTTGIVPRVPSFNFMATGQPGRLLLHSQGSAELKPSSPHTPRVVMLTATSAAQQAQQAPPMLTTAPSAVAAVRPPPVFYSNCKPPMVPVLVEALPPQAGSSKSASLRPVVPAQSLGGSPSAQQASKRARSGGIGGFCRTLFGGGAC